MYRYRKWKFFICSSITCHSDPVKCFAPFPLSTFYSAPPSLALPINYPVLFAHTLVISILGIYADILIKLFLVKEMADFRHICERICEKGPYGAKLETKA